ncbi:MAG: helix-turn-helix transcriptional regulator [Clostridia bacterium]|nr:helix-turn-helix transcriptional regulator [Clostridia bacterium]
MDIAKIGTFIKTQRADLNMTQKELAEKIGCTNKAVSRWETGKGLPDMSFIIPLSEALNISVNELLAGEKIIPDMQETVEIKTVNEIVKKNDETIISMMHETNKTVKRHTNSFLKLFILLCLQIFVLFIYPNFIPDTFEPLVSMIFLSAVIYAVVGFSKTQLKWLFPIAVILLFFGANPFDMSGDGLIVFVVGLYFAAGAYVIIAVCTLIDFLIKKLRSKIR